jgi:hypothetical protein
MKTPLFNLTEVRQQRCQQTPAGPRQLVQPTEHRTSGQLVQLPEQIPLPHART